MLESDFSLLIFVTVMGQVALVYWTMNRTMTRILSAMRVIFRMRRFMVHSPRSFDIAQDYLILPSSLLKRMIIGIY